MVITPRASCTSYGNSRRVRVSLGSAATALTARRRLLNTIFPGGVESLSRKLVLTLREAADYSGLPLTSIRQLVKRNELPAIKCAMKSLCL